MTVARLLNLPPTRCTTAHRISATLPFHTIDACLLKYVLLSIATSTLFVLSFYDASDYSLKFMCCLWENVYFQKFPDYVDMLTSQYHATYLE